MPFAGQEGVFFLGNLPGEFRKFVAEVTRAARSHGFERFVEPCAGQLVNSKVAADTGYPKIEASDVTCLSGVLGRCASNRGIEDMGIVNRDTGEPMTDPVELLFFMKQQQLLDDSGLIYGQVIYRDFMSREEEIKKQLAEQLTALEVPRMRYFDLDLMAHIENVKDDPKSLVVCNPPTYKGGYEKQYAALTRHISWNEPDYGMFDPEGGYRDLMEAVEDAPCLYLMYEETPPGEAVGDPVFAMPSNRSGYVGYMVSNHPETVADLIGKTAEQKRPSDMRPSKYHLLPSDHEITKGSKIDVVKLDGANIRWYRKLFTHNFVPSGASSGYGVIVDGYLAGIFGYLNLKFTGNGPTDEAFIGFLMTARSDRYRLNRLVYRVAMNVKSIRMGYSDLEVDSIRCVGTAMLTNHKRLNEMRGIMECVACEKGQQMRYKLAYRGPVIHEEYRKTLRWFIQNEREYRERKSRS